jgi:hypothetical protein
LDAVRAAHDEFKKNREAEGRKIGWNTESLMSKNIKAAVVEKTKALDQFVKASNPKPKPRPAKTREGEPRPTPPPTNPFGTQPNIPLPLLDPFYSLPEIQMSEFPSLSAPYGDLIGTSYPEGSWDISLPALSNGEE